VPRSARYDRIMDWVLAWLAALDADPNQELVKDEPFFVYRSVVDPRFPDLSLGPSDRTVARDRRMSHGPYNLGRFSTWIGRKQRSS
jgi:hypothetical protein